MMRGVILLSILGKVKFSNLRSGPILKFCIFNRVRGTTIRLSVGKP